MARGIFLHQAGRGKKMLACDAFCWTMLKLWIMVFGAEEVAVRGLEKNQD